MAAIVLDHVRKVFAGGRPAIADLDLLVADGERLVLVGPSGCGKSTVLRLIAGLEEPTAGRILIDGRDVTSAPPEDRDLAMVFQSYALYPHKTVRDNLAFGLRMRRTSRQDIATKIQAVADTLGIADVLDRMPAQLSGGQRQRVALGRAIVRHPRAFLLDEPLSNLDPSLRGNTRTELIELHRRLGVTMVYVTHDQEEAMTIGTRVAVLREGMLEQVAPPLDLYDRPVNVFVARFIGSPPMNLLSGVLINAGRNAAFQTYDQAVALAGERWGPTSGTVRTMGIRPQDLTVGDPDRADLRGRIEVVESLGHSQLAHVSIGGTGRDRVTALVAPDLELHVHRVVGMTLNRTKLHFFNGDGDRVAT